MINIPKRPPKKWFKSCVRGVEKSGVAYDPQAVCGDLWYHKMSVVQKKEAVRESEKSKRKR